MLERMKCIMLILHDFFTFIYPFRQLSKFKFPNFSIILDIIKNISVQLFVIYFADNGTLASLKAIKYKLETMR